MRVADAFGLWYKGLMEASSLRRRLQLTRREEIFCIVRTEV